MRILIIYLWPSKELERGGVENEAKKKKSVVFHALKIIIVLSEVKCDKLQNMA